MGGSLPPIYSKRNSQVRNMNLKVAQVIYSSSSQKQIKQSKEKEQNRLKYQMEESV